MLSYFQTKSSSLKYIAIPALATGVFFSITKGPLYVKIQLLHLTMKKSEGWSENSHLLKAEKRIFHSLNGQDEVKTGAGKKKR